MFPAGIIIMLIGGGLFWLSKKQKQTSETMKKTKAISVNQLVPNSQAEIEGTVVCSNPLKTPFSHRECVYYEYEVEKEVRKKNNEGRWETNWENVSDDKKMTPFEIKDKTGSVSVDPEDATIEARDLGEQIYRRGERFGDDFLSDIIDDLTDSNTRVTESALLTGESAYIFGNVTEGAHGLQFGKSDKDYLISHRSEAEVEKSTARTAVVMKVLGFIGLIAGVMLILSSFIN